MNKHDRKELLKAENEDLKERIANLEDNNRALILQAESHITWVRIKTEAFERLIHQLKEQID